MSPKFVICVFTCFICVDSVSIWGSWGKKETTPGLETTRGFESNHKPRVPVSELEALISTPYRTLLSASPSVDDMSEENRKSETTSLSTSTTTSSTTTTTTTTTTTPATTSTTTTTTTTPATTTSTEVSSTFPSTTVTDKPEKPKEMRDIPSFQDGLPTNNSGLGGSTDNNNSNGKDDGGITDKPGTTPRYSNETVIPETAESPNFIKNNSRDDYDQPRPTNESEQLQNGKRELGNLDGLESTSVTKINTISTENVTISDLTPDESNQVNVTVPRDISSNVTTGQSTVVQTTSGFRTGSTVSGSESVNNSQMILLVNLLIFSITVIV